MTLGVSYPPPPLNRSTASGKHCELPPRGALVCLMPSLPAPSTLTCPIVHPDLSDRPTGHPWCRDRPFDLIHMSSRPANRPDRHCTAACAQ
eukprot:351660-Chlamydomonas_euryale.AAC.1